MVPTKQGTQAIFSFPRRVAHGTSVPVYSQLTAQQRSQTFYEYISMLHYSVYSPIVVRVIYYVRIQYIVA